MARNRTVGSVVLPERPLLRGIANLFDFSGSMELDQIEEIREQYHDPPPIPSAEEAIRETWLSVGESMSKAIGDYKQTIDENATG